MDLTTFYALMSVTCFTLVGLWWTVVERHREWRTDPRRRRVAGGIYLSFLLPALMSMFAQINPANPLEYEPYIEMPIETLEHKVVIVVDDVANTGRTLFYAVQPLLKILPKKIEVAVLVDRTHKSFPIKADYIGLSLATTLLDNIAVDIQGEAEYAAYLT